MSTCLNMKKLIDTFDDRPPVHPHNSRARCCRAIAGPRREKLRVRETSAPAALFGTLGVSWHLRRCFANSTLRIIKEIALKLIRTIPAKKQNRLQFYKKSLQKLTTLKKLIHFNFIREIPLKLNRQKKSKM